jgi:transposase-like protein
MAGASFPQSLQEAIVYYNDADTAHAEMVKFRWPDGIVRCPTCGSTAVYFTPSRKIWQCKTDHPKRQFSVKVGSVMEDSALSISKWLIAAWLITNCKNGISSYELGRAIKVSQKSAWHMLHRIRLAMQGEDGGKLSGEVEIDETFIGGKARFMHQERRERILSKGSKRGKVAVMGLLERRHGNSFVRASVVAGTKRHMLMPVIRKNVQAGTTVYSDSLPTYDSLNGEFIHKVIDHAVKYVDGQIHTNGLENFWSLVKRMLKGTYVSVEPFHLFRYLDEQAFRFNNRKLSDATRFAITASSVFGKRLTFAELTAADANL